MLAKNILKVFFLCFILLLVAIPVLATDNPWNIIINIPEYRLYLYYQGGLFKSYKIAVGKTDSPSPTGEFQIINKVKNPTWYPEGRSPIPPGPNNPLGKYWMGLNSKGYGIHGNSAAWSIGAPVSHGCFRMDNHEIEELFTIVPVGTPVKVDYLTVKGMIDSHNQAWLEIYPDIYQRFNFEMKVQEALTELNWDFQPHLPALTCLITAKKPLTVMVPRRIKNDGGSWNAEVDAFYWNYRVYIGQDFLVKNNLSVSLPFDDLFQGYLVWNPFDIIEGEQQRLKWDEELNTLVIDSVKVLINGEKIDQGARFGKRRNILISYPKISMWFEAKQVPKPILIVDTPEGNQISGEFADGEFWVEPEILFINLKNFSYQWDETTWTLNLYYFPE